MSPVITCPTCKGQGRVIPVMPGVPYIFTPSKTCPECQGGGKVRGTAKQVADADQ